MTTSSSSSEKHNEEKKIKAAKYRFGGWNYNSRDLQKVRTVGHWGGTV